MVGQNQYYWNNNAVVHLLCSRSALSPKERAVSRSLRVLLEDHLYWVFVIDRYVNQEAKYLKDLSPSGGCRVGLFTEFIFELRRRRAVVAVTNQAYHQGEAISGAHEFCPKSA